MIAYAFAPGLSPSFSADDLVIIETISTPGDNSTTTSVSTAPGVTVLMVADKILRALFFTGNRFSWFSVVLDISPALLPESKSQRTKNVIRGFGIAMNPPI